MSDTPSVAPLDASAAAETQAFLAHRELLFALVYNLLGSVADTEDVLQETWLAWAPRAEAPRGERIEQPARLPGADRGAPGPRPPGGDPPPPRGLRRAVAARAAGHPPRRQLPSGDAADVAEAAVRTEAVSMALLVVLETLTPLERAVFVLGEVFGYTHPEIAAILGRRPAAVRQLAHRARAHVQARRPRYQTDPRLRRQVTERFVAAVAGGDLPALLRLLAPEVTLWADGGGKAPAAGPRPVQGREPVARLLTRGGVRSPRTVGVRYHFDYRQVNGDPAALLFAGDAPFAVIVLELTPDGQQVSGIYAVTNPDKLSRLGGAPPRSPATAPRERRSE